MTINLQQYFKNSIEKEAKISHFSEVDISVGKSTKIAKNILNQINDVFGQGYLSDSEYVVFFLKKGTNGWLKEDIKKLFDLTRRAFGGDASSLTADDFNVLASSSNHDKTEDDATSKIAFLKISLK